MVNQTVRQDKLAARHDFKLFLGTANGPRPERMAQTGDDFCENMGNLWYFNNLHYMAMNMAQEYSEIWWNMGKLSSSNWLRQTHLPSFQDLLRDRIICECLRPFCDATDINWSSEEMRKCLNNFKYRSEAQFCWVWSHFCRSHPQFLQVEWLNCHAARNFSAPLPPDAPGIGCGCRLESFSRNLRRHGSGVRIRRSDENKGRPCWDCMGLMSTHGESMWIYG